MIVTDASGLAALGALDVLPAVLDRYQVLTTQAAISWIESAAGRHGSVGEGARSASAVEGRLDVAAPDRDPVVTSRLDEAAGSCVSLAAERDAPFVLTGDVQSLHEIRRLVPGAVLTPPVVLAALVRLGAIPNQDARFRLETLAGGRRGLGAELWGRSASLLESSP